MYNAAPAYANELAAIQYDATDDTLDSIADLIGSELDVYAVGDFATANVWTGTEWAIVRRGDYVVRHPDGTVSIETPAVFYLLTQPTHLAS